MLRKLGRVPVCLVCLGTLISLNSACAQKQDKERKRLVPGLQPYCTTSKVVGSPEPPLPYRVQRVLPKLALNNPIAVERIPGSHQLLFIGSSGRKLNRTGNDPSTGEFDTLLEIDGIAFSIEFHPQFAKNGFVYIGMNGPNKKPKKCQIRRYTMTRDDTEKNGLWRLDPDSRMQIIEWLSDGHNGVAIAFGMDGMLYVTSGDGTSDSDTNLTGQGLDHLLSKVLRIDVDHPDEGRAYSVPKDNPFVGMKNVRPETWAYGFRNPWRMTVDPTNGNLWVGNNGQDLWEQIYLVKRGANYGWSVYEGGHIFYANRKLGPHPVSKPIFDHRHSEARSLTGGEVYFGKMLPDLHGAYLYGDHSTGKIWAAKHDGKKLLWHKEIADSTLAIAGFGLDGDGELLIVDYHDKGKGGFYTLVPNDEPDTTESFPQFLSQSGLFESVRDHQMKPGVIPYSVNAPLWSDGAQKLRFLAVPPTEESADGPQPSTIQGGGNRGWGFPNGTVLVKSFAMEMEEGNPESRLWLETRFLIRQQGEWVGYSYYWNDEQTDARLVRKSGYDRQLTIRTATGERKQVWRYPSRSECMVCHSRATNFVLGLSTAQINGDHEYVSGRHHQFDVLESLGLLKIKRPGEGADPLPKLVNPYDKAQDLTARARSYLHSNCAQCHVEAGGGNAQMNLSFHTQSDKMKLLDEKPLHDSYGVADARLVAPGDPERSILLHRIARRGRGQMPQLATSLVDQTAVELMRDWIISLKKGLAGE